MSAQQEISMPTFAACVPAEAPTLPERWRAVGLMIPFVRQQLDVGEFIYDSSLPGVRATVYGLESGAIDLLITETETYRLSGPHGSPRGCTALGHKFLPSNSWLPKDAVCVGETPLGGISMQWWKTAASDGRNKWHLYKKANRLPWRMILPAPSNDPPVIGDYAITYFPTFKPLEATNLTQLRDFCVANAKKTNISAATAKTARDLIVPDANGEAERLNRIQALIPGLTHQACSRTPPPRWPNQFFTTATISPISYQWSPYPSVVYYDWGEQATQVAVMHKTHASPLVPELISILKNGIGYSLERMPNDRFVCMASNPGLVRPDWMAAAGCECKGVIERNPDFGPDESSQIRACPVKEKPNRVNWAWYTTQGRPILFMEPAAYGNGVNIADYHLWIPGMKVPQTDLELPGQCSNPVGAGVPPSAMSSCSDCHTIAK
ncbi:MAG TPA: hypothetical protein VEJ43_12390 [Pseudolabrys sp.]|nr:hypothetical protein [Pseudolabrys sp.]